MKQQKKITRKAPNSYRNLSEEENHKKENRKEKKYVWRSKQKIKECGKMSRNAGKTTL